MTARTIKPVAGPMARLLTWATAVAVAALGVALISDPFSSRPGPAGLPPELADEPDLFLEDAVITQFRESGALKYRLASEQIRHFERDSLTRLAEPRLTLYSAGGEPPWEIQSRHGYVRNRQTQAAEDEEVVFLRERVVLEQSYADGRHITLNTPSLYIYPDREFAETDQDVMIDTDVGRTQAVGLRGDLTRGVLELDSTEQQRVHTIVLPEQFK